MRFYLGTHMPCWLSRTGVPLFISAVRLRGRKRFPRAVGRWALDSGGFSELAAHGEWQTSPRGYASEAMLWEDEIGGLDWCAIQDWMCEPDMLRMTGLCVEEHQRRTVESYLDLMTMAPDLPWAPVIQGWSMGEYEDCIELYAQHHVDLTKLPVVGVGSVCRRQCMMRAPLILSHIQSLGINVHAFGLKRTGLEALHQLGEDITSADSMAWSYHARAEKNGLQNDMGFALEWRDEMLAKIGQGRKARALI